MLQGFHYPLTPKGKSTLNPLPPWHYSADFLSIEFWADPAAVRAILPEGLDPDAAADGHANGFFMIGSSRAPTKNFWTLPGTSIVSSSFWWTRFLKEGGSPTVLTYLWTTMRRSRAAGVRAIQNGSGQFSRQAPLCGRDYNLVLLDQLLLNKNMQQVYCCNELNCAFSRVPPCGG